MKYFIPIDRKTIRKNPNAGGLKRARPGTTEVTLYAENCKLRILDDDRIIPTEYVVGDGRVETLTAMINDSTFLDDIEKYTSKYQVRYNRNILYCYSVFEPDYLFSYEPVDVTCNSCGAIFPSDLLQADVTFNGGEEYYSDTVCLECGAFDCCDVEYESISAVQNIDSVI